MNHPSNEQWMSYCYDELPKGERTELSAHLKTCAECADKVRGWDLVRKRMNISKVTRTARRTARGTAEPFTPMVLKWAAAVAVVCLAVALGRFSAARQNSAAAAELKAQLRAEFSQMLQNESHSIKAAALAESDQRMKELFKTFATEIAGKKELQAIYAALDKVDSQRASDFVALKKELDTLAVNADAELRTTERHLLELTAFARSTASPQE
jgi:anti-sigma factor RsiW